jgi:hypothetical protein
MIANVNEILGTVAETELAKVARRSARTIWNAHRAAFETTRVEAGKVISLALDEGQKLAVRVKAPKAHVAKKAGVRKSTRRPARRAA